MKRLRVSDNRRFLVFDDGAPFFWLGDTAWELFHRCTFEDADLTSKTGGRRASMSFKPLCSRSSTD